MLFTDGANVTAGGTSDSNASTTATTGDATSTSGEDQLSDAGKAALDVERTARKAAEKELKDLRTRLTALEDRDKSDVDRITGERDRLKADLDAREARLRDMAVTSALTTAATKAGARYPELIVQRVAGDANVDDDLNVKNADALMTAAKKDYPDLFRVVDGPSDGNQGRQDSNNPMTDMNRLVRRQAGYAG
jgi:hypothetical protein